MSGGNALAAQYHPEIGEALTAADAAYACTRIDRQDAIRLVKRAADHLRPIPRARRGVVRNERGKSRRKRGACITGRARKPCQKRCGLAKLSGAQRTAMSKAIKALRNLVLNAPRRRL